MSMKQLVKISHMTLDLPQNTHSIPMNYIVSKKNFTLEKNVLQKNALYYKLIRYLIVYL